MPTRVIEQTPTRITLRSRPPLWFPSILWTAVLGFLLIVCPKQVFHCTRSDNGSVRCHVERRLFWWTMGKRAMEGVRSATLEMGAESERRPSGSSVKDETGLSFDDTSRIVLHTEGGSVPSMWSYETGLKLRKQAVAELNSFLADPKLPSVTVVVGKSAWIWSAWIFLLFVATATLPNLWSKSYFLDKRMDLVWLGKAATFRLSEVQRFGLEEELPRGTGEPKPRKMILVMYLKEGGYSRLAPPMPVDENAEKLVATLEAFRSSTMQPSLERETG